MGSTETPAFASSAEAVQAMLAAAGFLADADHPSMPGAEKARCLMGLERFDAIAAVARGALLAAFDAADDYEADGQASTTAWLVNRS